MISDRDKIDFLNRSRNPLAGHAAPQPQETPTEPAEDELDALEKRLIRLIIEKLEAQP